MPPSAGASPSRRRRSARLAAQARRSTVNSAPDDPAEKFGLAGLIVLPIPDIDDIATIHTHAEERRAQLDRGSTQDTLIYYNATTAHLEALCSADPDGKYPGRITFFGDEIGLVFFRLVQPVHETAHLWFFKEMEHLIFQMDLKDNYIPTGSARYKGIGTRQKEGDSGIRPDPPRWAGNQLPTLVIEAGNSESLRLLHKDKDWWFDNSPLSQPQGDVRIVLLVKVECGTKRIIIEQWHRSHYESPTATVSIAPYPHTPFSLHDTSHWVVEGAPMVISFQEVFLRPIQERETDLVLTEALFANMAMKCWQSNIRI